MHDFEILFFQTFGHYIPSAGFAGYGDKRGRNKPIGPGGGTRRLHHMPQLAHCKCAGGGI
jgi:hypothetical protein